MTPTERGERGLRIGDLHYVSEPLDLGMLSGNRFSIVLRDVLAPPSVISSSIETLQNTGFINFFGMQRFGNSSVPTHAVGLKLLQSKWTDAASLILKERDGDSEEVLAARDAWNTDRDAKRALNMLPKWLVAERCSESLTFCLPTVDPGIRA
jgi:tRNA pseudouridine13 synthase